MQKIEKENNTIPTNIIDDMNVSYELGAFTWINPDNANQKGWGLNQEKRTKLADGKIQYLVLAMDDKEVKRLGGLGGIEIILNSMDNGFRIDYKSFPWYWDRKTKTGGYTGYDDLLTGRFTVLDSEILYLKYDITSHPYYPGFIKDMGSGIWGQISIQYGIGISDLPLVNAYLIG
jgi:hypothetical protein